MDIVRGLILLAVLSSMAACATGTKYQWGTYNTDLHKYYSHSITQEELARRLQIAIQRCEADGKIVPPGLYAEYGYLLYEAGQYEEAVQFFQKENDKWPESRPLMAKMIRNCKTKTSPDQGSKSSKIEAAGQEGLNPASKTVLPAYLVVLKSANIREKATTNCRIVASAKKGDQIQKIDESGAWSKVKLASGKTGWISKGLVKEAVQTSPEAGAKDVHPESKDKEPQR